MFGVLADPAYPPTQSIITVLQTSARTLGRQLIVVNARTDSDLETAFATFSEQHVGAVLVGVQRGHGVHEGYVSPRYSTSFRLLRCIKFSGRMSEMGQNRPTRSALVCQQLAKADVRLLGGSRGRSPALHWNMPPGDS
jgi:hypothetical protein